MNSRIRVNKHMLWASGFRGDVILKKFMIPMQTTQMPTKDHCLSYKLPWSFGPGELKNICTDFPLI